MTCEDEDPYDPEASWPEDDVDDDITVKEDECIKVEEVDPLVTAARFIVYTGCAQAGPCDLVVREEVLESASTLDTEISGVDVEADAEACEEEACEEEAVVGPEWPGWSGNILTPGDVTRMGWFSFWPNLDLCCPDGGKAFLGVPWLPRR